MGDEDADDASDNECAPSLWDGERSRNDVSQFDEMMTTNVDTKSVNTMTHTSLNSSRLQPAQVTAAVGLTDGICNGGRGFDVIKGGPLTIYNY